MKTLSPNPIAQCQDWLNEAIAAQELEPNAMTLATVDLDGSPDARIVYLKAIDKSGFYFFTNFTSRKGKQLERDPRVALVIFWPKLERQVRIKGQIQKATAEQSDEYFQKRPRGSQIGAWSSPQSQVISNRETLEQLVLEQEKRFTDKPVPRPPFWGGFVVRPTMIEFWQGLENRLHDRFLYSVDPQGSWKEEQLAP